MRLFLLSTVSTAALIAVALPATAGDNFNFTGVGAVNFSSGSSDALFGNDPTIYGAKGKGYWNLSPDVHLQADLFFDRTQDAVVDGWSSVGNKADAVGGAIHLLHPVDTRARVGIAGSIWNNDIFIPAGTNKTDTTYGLGAIEGQFFGTDWTLTGQAGLFSSFNCSSAGGEGCPAALESGTFASVKARYFLYENTAVSLANTQMWGKLSGDDGFFGGKSINANHSQWVFEIEHKFDDTPYAGAVGLEQESIDAIVLGANTSTVRISLRYYLDQPTLRSNDKSGAELDTPLFGNAPEAISTISSF